MVRKNNGLEQWIKFFLNGVIDTANDGINTFKSIIDLRLQYEQKILTLGIRAKNAQKLILHMFSKPIISIKSVEQTLGVSFNSASRLVNDLKESKILDELTGYSRNRLYVLRDYLNLFKK